MTPAFPATSLASELASAVRPIVTGSAKLADDVRPQLQRVLDSRSDELLPLGMRASLREVRRMFVDSQDMIQETRLVSSCQNYLRGNSLQDPSYSLLVAIFGDPADMPSSNSFTARCLANAMYCLLQYEADMLRDVFFQIDSLCEVAENTDQYPQIEGALVDVSRDGALVTSFSRLREWSTWADKQYVLLRRRLTDQSIARRRAARLDAKKSDPKWSLFRKTPHSGEFLFSLRWTSGRIGSCPRRDDCGAFRVSWPRFAARARA
jgi:plasmid maintenance system antidote protein VapI